MNISITKASIGKLPLPLSVLSSFAKDKVSSFENNNSAIKEIDATNLIIKLDLNSVVSQNQNIFTIKNVSSESNNLILDLSANIETQSPLKTIENITDSLWKLINTYNSLDNNSKQQIFNFLRSDVSIDKKIQFLKTFNLQIDTTTLEQFMKSLGL